MPIAAAQLLATGDSDYAPLVKKLRGFGKHIVGIGTEASASNRLIANCSEYKYWGTLVAEVDPVARATIGDTFPIAEAKRLVLSALEESATPEAKGDRARRRPHRRRTTTPRGINVSERQRQIPPSS